MALRWNRPATQSVSYTDHYLTMVTHYAGAPLDGWTWYSETDGSAPNPGTDDFLLAQIEAPGARTDFLQLLYKDWTIANGHLATADNADVVFRVPEQRMVSLWAEVDGAIILAGPGDVWNFLTYFKPTNFVNHQDAAVTSRRTEYRSPDTLSVTIGSPWFDVSENTAGPSDYFNESEAAYALTFDPASGLTFDMSGASNPRYHPFFKIRQWRSLQDPPSVTLAGVPLTRNVDYKADVKPMSRGHFAWVTKWHSTFESAGAVTTPDIGPGGTINGSPTSPVGMGAESFSTRPTMSSGSFPSTRRKARLNSGIGQTTTTRMGRITAFSRTKRTALVFSTPCTSTRARATSWSSKSATSLPTQSSGWLRPTTPGERTSGFTFERPGTPAPRRPTRSASSSTVKSLPTLTRPFPMTGPPCCLSGARLDVLPA
jgi:hypothetical protein